MVDFTEAPLVYGEANTAAFKENERELHYQADRLKNRFLLDFGLVEKNVRKGMQLKANGINTPCLLRSIHSSAPSDTNDQIIFEIHTDFNAGVKDRIALQYVPSNQMPFDHPEYILLPDYVIYINPGQTSHPRVVLEPINLMVYGVITT